MPINLHSESESTRTLKQVYVLETIIDGSKTYSYFRFERSSLQAYLSNAQEINELNLTAIKQRVKSVESYLKTNIPFEIKLLDGSKYTDKDRSGIFRHQFGEWGYDTKYSINIMFVGFSDESCVTSIFEIDLTANKSISEYELDLADVDFLQRPSFTPLCQIDTFVVKSLIENYQPKYFFNTSFNKKALEYINQNDLYEWAYTNVEYTLKVLNELVSEFGAEFKTNYKEVENQDSTMQVPDTIDFICEVKNISIPTIVTLKFTKKDTNFTSRHYGGLHFTYSPCQ